jgi:hypothetical protein
MSEPTRVPPNPRLQRTPLRAPLSRKPFGDGKSSVGNELPGMWPERRILSGG